MASAAGGEVEVDVAEWFQAVAEEVITRATFGRSYDSGRAVYRMQARLMAFASEAFRKVLVPGYRYANVTTCHRRLPLVNLFSSCWDLI
jgi:PHYB activation tagged suppressor 1